MGAAHARELACGGDSVGRGWIDVRVWAAGRRTTPGCAHWPETLVLPSPAGNGESDFQINAYNRGVAVLGGRVFMVTLDCHLIALDARSGRVLWDRRIADTLEGYTLTGAPLALDNRVIVGVSGGEMGVRGFLDAYDVNDGHQLWRFNTIPGPGEPGHETWSGESWKTGSGATWLTGSYDPQLHLLYWAVGNPGPDFDPTHRQGDNLCYPITVFGARSGHGPTGMALPVHAA